MTCAKHRAGAAVLGSQASSFGIIPLACLNAATIKTPIDIFRDESIRYALELYKAGVSTELHVRPGSPHGFDRLGDTEVARRRWADRLRVIREL